MTYVKMFFWTFSFSLLRKIGLQNCKIINNILPNFESFGSIFVVVHMICEVVNMQFSMNSIHISYTLPRKWLKVIPKLVIN